ncbi:MAG: ATP-binding protein [Caldilineaceae bacterium SB0661_bin_32]|uniref:ATP-binding protein n=1 Tax=Caldilineaceae bacterium SB0661_bin_32 TaxID=2605255 RepID=A0A6B1D3Y1_9CHLR|nr:ATP-binding protein [Caldilineaceae bacterium SB0661_bin_32]
MLIEFSVANYRSFRDKVTFSMVASSLKAKNAELNETNLFAAHDRLRLLTSAAIYGANASGKSNLISAMNFMRRFVIYSANVREEEDSEEIDVDPFRLSTETDTEPSFFEAVFVVKDRRFRYGFETTAKRVEAEWLYVAPKARESRLFEREEDGIALGEKYKTEGRDMAMRTRPTALFLSVCAQFKGKIAEEVLDWFRSLGIATGLMDTGMRKFTERMFRDKDSAKAIETLLTQLDLGIKAVRLENVAVPAPNLQPLRDDAPEDMRRLHDEMRKMESALESTLRVLSEVADFNLEEEEVVRTVHRKTGEGDKSEMNELFDLDTHESEGTKKLFSLSGPLVDTLRRGGVLIIDELNARLHPLLTKEIVRLFNDPVRNARHAQLVFATQDTNLLDNQLLRRDQIWFVEKDREEASYLYSLAEFKVRNDAVYEKDYIHGRYGAIPFLGGMRHVLREQV